jgi:hypothetical protein
MLPQNVVVRQRNMGQAQAHENRQHFQPGSARGLRGGGKDFVHCRPHLSFSSRHTGTRVRPDSGLDLQLLSTLPTGRKYDIDFRYSEIYNAS